VRIRERNSSADTKASKEGGGSASGAGAEIPLQPTVKTMVRKVVPLQPDSGVCVCVCTLDTISTYWHHDRKVACGKYSVPWSKFKNTAINTFLRDRTF